MKNLLRGELSGSGLYRQAAQQWQKTVGGLTVLGIGSVFGSFVYENESQVHFPLAMAAFGGMALLGAGVTGVGVAELQQTSRELEAFTAQQNLSQEVQA